MSESDNKLARVPAQLYQEIMVKAVYGGWARSVVDAVDPRRGDRALDLACGTGVVARVLAQRVGTLGTVVGIDIDPEMLSVAREYSPPQQGQARIDWEQGNANQLHYEDGYFDIITCQQGLPYFSNRSQAMHELYRTLGSGGRIGMLVWRGIQESPGFYILAQVLERFGGPDLATPVRAGFSIPNKDDIRSLFMIARLRSINIDPVTGNAFFASVNDFLKSQFMGTPLMKGLSILTPEARAALYPALTEALGPFTTPNGLIFPMGAHLISAKK